MPERSSINPVWAPLVAAIAVIGLIIIGYKMLQTQRHVEAVQTELESTNARASELEKHAARLSSEREDAVRQRNDIQDKLDEATTERDELRNKLDQSTSTIQELQKQLELAQSAFDDTQSRLKALQSELESFKQALDEANAKADDANGKRDELQAKLNLANSEIDRLKGELEQAKKVPAPEFSTLTWGLAPHSGEGSKQQPRRDFACAAVLPILEPRNVGFWHFCDIQELRCPVRFTPPKRKSQAQFIKTAA